MCRSKEGRHELEMLDELISKFFFSFAPIKLVIILIPTVPDQTFQFF